MIALIPAFEPDGRLVRLVHELRTAGVPVVVVDDGSGPRYADVFAATRGLGATVLTHQINQGKGRALKTGVEHIMAAYPGQDVVCADSDGQHIPADVLAVAEEVARAGTVVLGVRAFTGSVPARSRFGNTVSRLLFALATGTGVSDTQTGLRGYPAGLLRWVAGVPGERFDYEQRLLLAAARDCLPLREVPIETVYLDHNSSSHFRPVLDSLAVMVPVLGFLASSFLGFCVDTVALLALIGATGSLLGAVVGARLVSAAVNFLVNRRWVFRQKGAWRTSAVRYAALAGVLLAANFGLMTALTSIGVPLLAAKVLTETLLVAASYVLQRQVVFADPPLVPVEVAPAATTWGTAEGRPVGSGWVAGQAS